jgi:hypothetical protein
VRPGAQHSEGQIEVLTRGRRATGFFRLPEREEQRNGGEVHKNGVEQKPREATP